MKLNEDLLKNYCNNIINDYFKDFDNFDSNDFF